MEIKIVLPLEKVTTMIQKSELQQVPVEQRVPGRIYGVSDDLLGTLHFMVLFGWESQDSMGTKWKYWFALPESMLPVREAMPEIGKEYEFDTHSYKGYRGTLIGFEFGLKGGFATAKADNIRPIQTMPSLTIPQGTKQEQIKALESLLEELKK
jgi:hypothetical protein